MNQLEIAVERVLDDWSGAEGGTYESNTALRSIWLRNHPVSPPFDSGGAPQLVTTLHNDSFLRHCPAAREISVGFFVTGGGIQTVGDLFQFLNPCNE